MLLADECRQPSEDETTARPSLSGAADGQKLGESVKRMRAGMGVAPVPPPAGCLGLDNEVGLIFHYLNFGPVPVALMVAFGLAGSDQSVALASTPTEMAIGALPPHHSRRYCERPPRSREGRGRTSASSAVRLERPHPVPLLCHDRSVRGRGVGPQAREPARGAAIRLRRRADVKSPIGLV